MKFTNFCAAIKSGVPSICWAFSATLAILVAALIGYALAFPVFYGLSAFKTIHPYAQALAELVFTLGTTGTPLLLCWLYFSGRLRSVTGWTERLPALFHLDHYLPGFPAVFGLNPRRVGTSFKSIMLWAFIGTAAVYTFDYLTGDLMLASESHGSEHALTHISGINFFVSSITVAFLASFLEEVLFRGFVLNIWRTAFATEISRLVKTSTEKSEQVRRILVFSGVLFSLIFSAALFSIAHLEGLLSQFFFGLVAGFIYLQTRTLWSSIAMHVINNAILPVMLLVGYLNGGAATSPTPFTPPAAGTVGFVSQEVIDREGFNKGNDIFLQICLPADCAKQLDMLRAMAAKFPQIVFYQADATKVPALKERLEREAGAAKSSGDLYPLYIYASDAMHIAPRQAKGQSELEIFIQQLGSSQPMETYKSEFCDEKNKGTFDGAKLYKCAFDQTLNTDLSLLDKDLRQAFIEKHKGKESLLAPDDESAAVKAINLMVLDLHEMHSSFFTREEFVAEQNMLENKEVNLQVLPEGHAAVKVRVFGNRVSEEFSQALYQACTGKPLPVDEKDLQKLTESYVPEKDCSLKGLIIDLRNNPGGRLDKVTEMMQAVIKDGPTLTMLSRKGDVLEEVKESVNATALQRRVFEAGELKDSKDFPRFWKILPDGLPIVILINEGSASASEILAGALQSNKLATVVGRPSFGKEVGQTITPVDFGFALRITTFKFLPGGREMDGAIIPDFPVAEDGQFMPVALSVLHRGAEALSSLEKEEAKAAKAILRNKTKQEHAQRDAKIHAARAASN